MSVYVLVCRSGDQASEPTLTKFTPTWSTHVRKTILRKSNPVLVNCVYHNDKSKSFRIVYNFVYYLFHRNVPLTWFHLKTYNKYGVLQSFSSNADTTNHILKKIKPNTYFGFEIYALKTILKNIINHPLFR